MDEFTPPSLDQFGFSPELYESAVVGILALLVIGGVFAVRRLQKGKREK